MALRFAKRRTAVLGASMITLATLGVACGGDSSEGDELGAPPQTSGPRRPGGGPSSGSTIGTSSSSSSSSSSSGSSSSSSSGDSSGSSSSSSSGGGSSSSSSGEPACADGNDAPDVQASASLVPITANGIARSVSGVLDGASDVDWYAFDITGSPTTVVYVDENLPVKVCVYYECKAGTLSLTCKAGSSPGTDQYGNKGCCAIGSASTRASVATTMYCASAPDDSWTDVSISSLADQCANYTAKIAF